MKRYHATLTGVLTAAMFASAVALTVGAHSALAQADPSVNELVERLTPKPGQADSGALDRFRKFDFRQVRPEDREWLQTRPNTDLYITFDLNSARMSKKAYPLADKIGRALSSPELASSVFLIGGHTDAKGSDTYNLDLSQRRAEDVKRYIVQKFGISEQRLMAKGFGKTQLKNAGDPFSVENRRVQFVNVGTQ